MHFPAATTNVTARRNQEIFIHGFPALSGTRGTLPLQTEIDPQTETINRTIRLEASADGRSVFLAALDIRKPGSQWEWRVELRLQSLSL